MPRGNNEIRRKRERDREQRLEIIAPLWRKNWTYAEIRKEVMRRLGKEAYSVGTVCKDVKVLIAQWREQRLNDTEEKITTELARLDQVIREAWEMWEKSKQDYNRKSQSQTGIPVEGENGQQLTIKSIQAMMWDAEQRGCGDPRYLDVILKALNQRCKLMGLDQMTIDVHAGMSGAIEIRYVDAGVECAGSEDEVRTREGLNG